MTDQKAVRVALYGRVSTKDKGQDVRNQTDQLREFCQRQNWQIVTEYTDHASGKRGDRIQFQEMFEAASRREIDAGRVQCVQTLLQIHPDGIVRIRRSRSPDQPLGKVGIDSPVARMLRNHEELLLNWFRAKGEISAGSVEGLNNKLRVLTRRSYGFPTYEAMEIALDEYQAWSGEQKAIFYRV